MKIQVHPADEGGCGHYRIRFPYAALKAQGHDIQMRDELMARFKVTPGEAEDELISMEQTEADVIVLQRPLNIDTAKTIPALQALGKAVVVDIDDDFNNQSPSNVSFRRTHPKYSPRRNWRILEEACKMADLVTVSTPRIAEVYGGHGRVRILPNCVPEWYLNTHEKQSDRVGWTGSILTHPHDLEVTHGALNGIKAPFRVIGTGRGVQKRLGLTKNPESTGWLDMSNGEYQRAIAKLKVGIVPLTLIAFNEAKSYLKGLEYASLGVPFVASGTGEYRKLAAMGAGSIANKGREWRREINKLVLDDNYWAEMRESGLSVAREQTYEKNAWKWAEAYEDARINAAIRVASAA